jgi:hypothetical protein
MSNVPNFNPNVLSASTGVLSGGTNPITYAGVTALTLAAPFADGQVVDCWDEGGHDHVVTVASVGSPPTQGINGIHTTLTFNGTAGSGFSLVARGTNWYVRYLNGVTVS